MASKIGALLFRRGRLPVIKLQTVKHSAWELEINIYFVNPHLKGYLHMHYESI